MTSDGNINTLFNTRKTKRKLLENDKIAKFINTRKAFKIIYMFYFETFPIMLNPSSAKHKALFFD